MARTQIDASLVPTAAKLANYKKPQLGFGGVTAVGIDNYRTQSGTNYSQIIFPDGNWREEGDSTRRTFVITRNAVLTNSGAQSGLRTSLSEANNTWYALYAVKITDSASGFVVVGDTTLPTMANIPTLNGFYGTNGWEYLGMIRNGDNADVPGDILDFVMSGNITMFANVVNPIIGTSNGIWNGMELASGTGITTISWTYATGVTGKVIPAHLRVGDVTSVHTATAATFLMTISDAPTRNFDFQAIGLVGNVGPSGVRTHGVLTKGFQHNQTGSGNMSIVLTGFVDDALGVGSNPQTSG